MVILRFIAFLVLITLCASFVLYLFTRNRRYLSFAWGLFKFAVVCGLVFGVFYVLERLLLII